ncbi:nucleotidyltransferase domain protein [Oxobacter pfennigii]|uniref:Nucleotidyltransferase domain protein n=1 Tax=Oxobacter pfennigii TaxID=36849 RepID=A0A0P8WBS2_9CLOT|nr:nucleotidyltransferase domain-containing protein [Oxobacter pfennigii]KPU45174.1 nucleotidyltransferase domain protein [Oxobacter pfennigii]
MNIQDNIDSIKKQIIAKYSPVKLILFGSWSKMTGTDKSDIDLCIIKDTVDKKDLLTDMYLNIESDLPIDIIIYTEQEWFECVNDTTSFAYSINQQGVSIHG